jgi:sulfonate transport system substrate-binding protein
VNLAKSIRLVAAPSLAVGALLLAGMSAAGASATRHAPKEDDSGAVINIEGDTATLNPIQASGLGPTFTKELAAVGASYQLVGNFPSEAPGITALEGGSLDIVSGSITATIGAWAGDAPVRVIGYGAAVGNGSAILVPASSPIKSVQDLVGKTVGVNQAGTGQYTLDQALNYYHIPISSVQQVYLQPTTALAAFGSGQVQAWATFATNIPIAVTKFDARVLVTAGKVHGQNFTVTVVSDSFARKYPHLVKLYFDIMHEAAARLEKNPTAYDQYLVSNEGFDQAEVAYTNAQLTFFDAVTAKQVKEFQAVADLFYKDGSVPVDVTVRGRTIDANNLK